MMPHICQSAAAIGEFLIHSRIHSGARRAKRIERFMEIGHAEAPAPLAHLGSVVDGQLPAADRLQFNSCPSYPGAQGAADVPVRG
jgi:hypothetical protein